MSAIVVLRYRGGYTEPNKFTSASVCVFCVCSCVVLSLKVFTSKQNKIVYSSPRSNIPHTEPDNPLIRPLTASGRHGEHMGRGCLSQSPLLTSDIR